MVLEKAKEPEIKLPTSAGSKKQERSRKTSISALLTKPKPLTLCGSQQIVENSERNGNTRSFVSWEMCMQVKKRQLEPNMEQQTGSKLGRSFSRLYMVTLLV